MLEQADGNVEQALKEIRALTGEGEGYVVEAEVSYIVLFPYRLS